eukprot:snap_masked-scaffold_15-processed-gene-8.54-mRNA-1 protein AED:0.04 eAED:0.05 QI:0/-1/0/1/-1/1/1/0/252
MSAQLDTPEKINTWQNTSLKQLCECEMCATGKATTHNDASHDQSLYLKWPLLAKSDAALPELNIVGGTTKCARVMSKFLETSSNFGRGAFEGSSICEVGTGTGLVGLVLTMLGGNVMFTDQSIVLELLQENIESNLKSTNFVSELCGMIEMEELYWGADFRGKLKGREGSFRYVIGSDLIFAKENIPLLLSSFKTFCPVDCETEILFAHIDRFSWENSFFDGMISQGFASELIYTEDEINIFKFKRVSELAE